MTNIKLLKLCRRKSEHKGFLFKQNGHIVVPKKHAIYRTEGFKTVDGEKYYEMRLIGAFSHDHVLNSMACLPVDLFNSICEWVKIEGVK